MEENNNKPAPQTPINSVMIAGVKISIWEHVKADGSKFQTCSVQKCFKDKVSGEWKNGSSFSKNDLSSLAFACSKAYDKMVK
jgi:hypothetical protein